MVASEDDSPLIYGIEFQARALCAQTNANAEPMPVRFLVGTQSLKNENQVHLLEFQEELSGGAGSLKKLIFKHSAGEIWDINCSPQHPNLLTTCYAATTPTQAGSSTSALGIQNCCTLWKSSVDLSTSSIDEDTLSGNSALIRIADFQLPESAATSSDSSSTSTLDLDRISGPRKCRWNPEDGQQLISMEGRRLLLWNVETHQLQQQLALRTDQLSKLTSKSCAIENFAWSPHSNCSIIGLAAGNSLFGKDLRCRAESDFAWRIEAAHSQQVRDLNFNPNAQYYLASCGDDCEYKFWDVRNTREPAISMQAHSHWVWSVRYNQYHDQLVLTCSSDARVVLSRIATFSAQPFGHLLDEDVQTDEEEEEGEEGEEEGEEPAQFAKQPNVADTSSSCCASEAQRLDKIDNKHNNSNIKKRKLKDEVISVYDDHEDSVYAAEWSNADPWMFASLSYDGRLVINKVCKEEKYNQLI